MKNKRLIVKKIVKELLKNGFCVIENIISPRDCDRKIKNLLNLKKRFLKIKISLMKTLVMAN